jgi:uncharacterized protein
VRLAREEDVSHFDAAPVHLVTDGSVSWLAARVSDASVDTRRFRPQLRLLS